LHQGGNRDGQRFFALRLARMVCKRLAPLFDNGLIMDRLPPDMSHDDLPAPHGSDLDPQETAEWQDSLQALIEQHGPERARFMLDRLLDQTRRLGISWQPQRNTPYVNSISVAEQDAFPGLLDIEQKLCAIMRWNALVMVVQANARYGELGGHISSYASAADLFEVGFNHFFRARHEAFGGDLVYFQPHSAPGVYARAYLEGRLSEDDLRHYRQEISAAGARSAGSAVQGLSSYPHPYLMPEFWQFPTGSMGLGPISAVYQARFLRYLEHRHLLPEQGRKIWGFFGDGEMDEPESLAGCSLAAREKLDNLIFVINCNLQRLDGPVRGNGRIIDELETVFAGAGWHVIKLVWGSDWDGIFARDTTHALERAFANTVDGQFQTYSANDGQFNREQFFGQNPELAKLIEGMSNTDIERLHRGGHDLVKIHAAYAKAARHRGQPCVILAKTMKGYGMGESGQGKMTSHQQKKLGLDDLRTFRERFKLPLTDEQLAEPGFYQPDPDSPEMRYLRVRRAALGGALPVRQTTCPQVPVPPLARFAEFALDADQKEMSTTMAFVRMLANLLKDSELGSRIVPIVADEARTFGMASLFRQVGIYAPTGQTYQPEDASSMLYYREAREGQILEEGITEAGAMASWTAAATSYSVHGMAMLPFYIYYSMFGFQRVGDLIWAAADQRARGFLLGATSGRTTLGGEGLQHQDGHSHVMAATIPNCKAYDPGLAGELAVIMHDGMRRMLVEQEDVFYYLTVMNENFAQPSIASDAHEGILRGLHRLPLPATLPALPQSAPRITLLGSGAILYQVLAAQQMLAEHWQVAAEVCSVTSFSELARDGQACVSARLLGGAQMGATAGAPAGTHTAAPAGTHAPYASTVLAQTDGPILAATDYVRAVPEQIRAFLPSGRAYWCLGTDGFGRSDTRAQLRRFFQVSCEYIVLYALAMLAENGQVGADVVGEARRRYKLL
jgi:pyruvate dehydrogenase E1 component